MDTRWARVARGWTAAGFAVFVAALSHTVVGGPSPAPFALGVSLVISGALCTILAGRTQSVVRLTIGVGFSQFLFHGLFSGLGAPVAAAHHMAAMPMDAPATAHHDSAAMWLAHAVAGVITVTALRYAGIAFWGVADTAILLFARLTAVLVPVVPGTPHPAAVASLSFVPRDLALLLSPMRRRGPPMELA